MAQLVKNVNPVLKTKQSVAYTTNLVRPCRHPRTMYTTVALRATFLLSKPGRKARRIVTDEVSVTSFPSDPARLRQLLLLLM